MPLLSFMLRRLSKRGSLISLKALRVCTVQPFTGAHLDPVALEFTGIDPYHPFRLAVPEEQALQTVFSAVYKAIEAHGCSRAILVGHNPAFDLAFIKAAIKRTGIKPNPFHS